MSSGGIIDTIKPLDLTPSVEITVFDDIEKSLGLDKILPPVPEIFQPKDIPSISSVEDFFIRGIVIILGFIFVAVGLSMFKG